MLKQKIDAYIAFVRQCIVLLAGEKAMLSLFIVLSVVGALTEGIGVSLLVPLLDSQGGPSGQGGFAGIPILKSMSALFSGLQPHERIQAVVILLAVVLVLRNLLQYAIEVLGATIPLRLERELNLRSYSALMTVEISYIQQNEYGNLLNGVGGWSQRVTIMLTNVAGFIANAMTVVAYAVLMFAISWMLTLFAVCFLLLMSLVLKWLTTTALHRTAERLNLAAIRVNQIIMESLTGMKIVRLAAAESYMARNYAAVLSETNLNSRTFAKLQALSGPMLSTCAGLFICSLLFSSAIIHAGEPTTWVAPILLFLFLLFRLVGPVSSLNAARIRIVGNLHAFELLTKFYAETERRLQPNGHRPATPLRKAIVFDRVNFSYPGGNKPVLQDISTSIDCGKMIAVVGPSGAGKSTLINLVTRLYDASSGQILVDGVDVRELDIQSWRRRLAVVTQDTFIFNDTVAKNISFGRGDVPADDIKAAATLAAAGEFIDNLPQAYDTLLGDRGTRLSGGQQQRIAIARAILANPDVLILDEATSNLDTFTERAIQDAMEQMSKSRTLLVIAHRLSTIRKAHKVIVMDKGRIVEEGQHHELLDRRGIYWEMVEHQRLDLIDEDAKEAVAGVST